MRAIITGYVTGIRFGDVKGVRMAEIDLLQVGTERLPAKSLTFYVSSRSIAEPIVSRLNAGDEPIAHFLTYLKVNSSKEIEVEVIEMLELVDHATAE